MTHLFDLRLFQFFRVLDRYFPDKFVAGVPPEHAPQSGAVLSLLRIVIDFALDGLGTHLGIFDVLDMFFLVIVYLDSDVSAHDAVRGLQLGVLAHGMDDWADGRCERGLYGEKWGSNEGPEGLL